MNKIFNFIINIVKTIPVLNTYFSFPSHHINTISPNSKSNNVQELDLDKPKKRSIKTSLYWELKKDGIHLHYQIIY